MKWLDLFLIFCLSAVLIPQTGVAVGRERCFRETGYCISGPILIYWERNGGLRVFGFPISNQSIQTAEDRMLTVQWFERDRLEIQADGHVTAGRLGARYLELQGRPWQTFPTVAQADPGCAYFAVTGHQVCEPFLIYWRVRGGLERFGYPITERMNEEIEGKVYPVQYFERRRMEYHPELAGTPYEVLLGRLGADVMRIDNCVLLEPMYEPIAYAYRRLLGCPIASSRELVNPLGPVQLKMRPVPLAVQRFERGIMLWVRRWGDAPILPEIFVLTADSSDPQRFTWQMFADEWQEGTPIRFDETPPVGRYAPERGFGYVWVHNAEVRSRLGWAVEPEQGETGGHRQFFRGFMISRPSNDTVFLFLDSGEALVVPRRN
jgi:hypothetical protein